QDLGVDVKREGEKCTITAKTVNTGYLETEAFKRQAASLRGSIMILGPLLARFGKAKITRPGCDKIGRRKLDTHFYGFQKLGARFSYKAKSNLFDIDGTELSGNYMLLDEASV